MSESTSITGRWRITEMDNWDQEAVDLVQLEGHIYFHLGDDSEFRAERFNGVVQ